MKVRLFIAVTYFLLGIFIYALSRLGIFNSYDLFIFIRNYVPDFCWCLSFYFACMGIIIKTYRTKSLIIVPLYVLILALLYELLQYLQVVNGYADYYDVLTYLFAITLSCLIEIFIRRYKNEKS